MRISGRKNIWAEEWLWPRPLELEEGREASLDHVEGVVGN